MQEPPLQSGSQRHFLTTNWPRACATTHDTSVPAASQKRSSPTNPFPSLCQHQHVSPPPPSAPLVVNSFSSGAGRGCLERLQAGKLSRNRIPPQHVIISLLEAKQLRQLFPCSHLAVLYTHRLSAGPLTPARLHHHADVTQPGCRLRPADLRRAQLLSAPCKTHSH